MLIFDEVQTGMGRTGKLWGCEHSGMQLFFYIELLLFLFILSLSILNLIINTIIISPFFIFLYYIILHIINDFLGVVPDIMAVGKGFGGGVMPAGACIATPKAWSEYIADPFLMTTTFGGNPLALSAAIAAMEVVCSENLAEQARVKGDYFLGELRKLATRFPSVIKEVRGLGLMIGIEFHSNVYGWNFSSGIFLLMKT